MSSPETKESNSKKWLFSIACILLAAIVTGGLYFMRTDDLEDICAAADSVLYLEAYGTLGGDELIGTASGFLLDAKGERLLITNYHVIQDARKIVAKTADGEYSTDIYLVLDYDEVADLAVLRAGKNFEGIPLTLADSDSVKKGDAVYAVGYPLGLANTLSDGIVSSRYVDVNNCDVIQVTAAVSGGNSGGPLLNEDGQVIGIICGGYVAGQNLNIAISANTLNDMLDAWTAVRSTENLAYWRDRPENK